MIFTRGISQGHSGYTVAYSKLLVLQNEGLADPVSLGVIILNPKANTVLFLFSYTKIFALYSFALLLIGEK